MFWKRKPKPVPVEESREEILAREHGLPGPNAAVTRQEFMTHMMRLKQLEQAGTITPDDGKTIGDWLGKSLDN